MKLDKKKILASKALNVGAKRIQFDVNRLDEIKALSGKVVVSQDTQGPQSHQKTMSLPRARTADRSAASPRSRHVAKHSC